MLDRKHWQTLSRFESHDYVIGWYQKRHNRSLNAARTKEITSCFSQGREYFVSAADAAMSVRPLLLYYGVLALSRGAIMLLDTAKQESSLKPSHGLEIFEWQNTFKDGISSVLELQFRATNGTFNELVEAVGNKQQTSWFISPNLNEGIYCADYPKPSFLSDSSTLTIDDLVSRDDRFIALYGETTGRPTKIHMGEVVADPTALEVTVFAFPGVSQSLVETCFGMPSGIFVRNRTKARRLSIPNFSYRIPGTDLNSMKPLLPVTKYSGGDGFFVIEDFENGDRISEFLKTFLLSYVMGMLVRYFPSKWISLLRNEKGDAAQPLLMAVVNAIEADFPKQIEATLG